MRDIFIYVSRETRMVNLTKTVIGNDSENLQGNLIFLFDDEFVNGQARIEYVINENKNYQILTKEGETYTIPIKNVLTKKGQIDMQLVITEGNDEEEIPVFKSNVFYLICNRSINAEIEQPDEYLQWIEIANIKLNEIDESTQESEIQSEYAKEQGDYAKETGDNLNNKLNNGEFDGATFIPNLDEEGNLSWTNNKNLENPPIQNIKGPQGVMGPQGEAFKIKKTYSTREEMIQDFDNMQVGDYVMITSNIELEDNAKLYSKGEFEWIFITDFSGATGIQGPQGPQGIQGIQGVPGPKGEKPIKGVDYFTEEEKNEMISEMTDDANSKFNQNVEEKTNEFNVNAENKTNEFNANKEALQEEIDDLYGNQIRGTAIGTNITIQDSSNLKMASLVVDGKSTQNGTPTPDAPIEIKSAGYTNLLDETTLVQGGFTYTNGEEWDSDVSIRSGKIKVKPNTTYTFSCNEPLGEIAYFYLDDEYNFLYGTGKITNSKSYSFTTVDNAAYVEIRIGYRTTYPKTISNNYEPILVEGPTPRSYVPYGKYGVELICCNENLFNIDDFIENTKSTLTLSEQSDDSCTFTPTATVTNYNLLNVEENTSYKITLSLTGLNGADTYFYAEYTDGTKEQIGNLTSSTVGISKDFTFTSNNTKTLKYINMNFYDRGRYDSYTINKCMVKKTTTIDSDYVVGKLFKKALILDEPLYDLPNGVKDQTYIKNGRAYLKKIVGRVDLGNFSWSYNSSYGFKTSITGAKLPANNNSIPNAMCDVYVVATPNNCYALIGDITSGISITAQSDIITREINYTDAEIFTNAMSGYYLYYELAEPYEIDLGKVTLPKTYKNITHVSNSENTNMEIVYYKDLETVINDLTSAIVTLGAEIEQY